MTPLRIVTATVLAGLVALGVAGAPRLLEPGRSERSGVILAPTLSGETGGIPADWTHDGSRAVARRADGFVTLRSSRRGLQIASRQIAVALDRCYVARLRLAATKGVTFALLDGSATDVLLARRMPPSPRPVTRSFTFQARERRVTLALVATRPGASLKLGKTTVLPQACPTTLPAE